MLGDPSDVLRPTRGDIKYCLFGVSIYFSLAECGFVRTLLDSVSAPWQHQQQQAVLLSRYHAGFIKVGMQCRQVLYSKI